MKRLHYTKREVLENRINSIRTNQNTYSNWLLNADDEDFKEHCANILNGLGNELRRIKLELNNRLG